MQTRRRGLESARHFISACLHSLASLSVMSGGDFSSLRCELRGPRPHVHAHAWPGWGQEVKHLFFLSTVRCPVSSFRPESRSYLQSRGQSQNP